jgi:hypothetical protein
MPTTVIAKSINPKKTKRSVKPSGKRNVLLKSASWYSAAAQSIGISDVLREER